MIDIAIYKRVLAIMVMVSCTYFVNAQDVIRLQLKDSINGKVLAVNKKDVIYQSQEFYDSGTYAIKRNKVLDIEYSDGRIVTVSKNRWDRLYRPFVFSSIGSFGADDSDDFYLSTICISIGHKGIFRMPVKGLGLLYNTEAKLGKYTYDKSHDSLCQYCNEGPFYVLNASLGLEYRYSFYRGFGLFGQINSGFSYMNLYKDGICFYSKQPVYSFITGVSLNRCQLGLSYTWGQLKREKEPQPGEVMQLINKYHLSELHFYISYAF